MGIYRVTSGAVGKALPIGVGNNTISGPSAWLFENQSGTLGTNLNGSLIYSGAGGDIRAILSGVVGIQNKVTALNLDATFTGANPFYAGFAAGSGYVQGNAVATTDVTTVPNSPATVPLGLTVNITAPVPTTNASTPGTGYPTGGFTVTGGTGTGLNGVIDTITGGGATGPINVFTISDGGVGYTAGDVLTIVAGDGINGTMTLATAPNGAVTAITINAAGANYSVGDIITIQQAGSGLDCKFCIREVQSDLPVITDAVVFEDVPAGTILPVAVDYVVATLTTATGMVACK